MTARFTIDRMGDRGLLVRFGDKPSTALTAVLAGLATAAGKLDGVLDSWPGLTTVLIETENHRRTEVESLLPQLLAGVRAVEGTLHDVEIIYDGEDLAWVCEHLGIDQETLVEMHSGQKYDVRLLGSPGFVYLSDVPSQIAVPRLDEPRPRVAAGSVGIGGRQAGIYRMSRPGGWRIIGRSEKIPAMTPGDRVRFVPL